MILNSITLNNFRQYKGNQVVVFETNPDKNVTVILGNNTSGKTTLVQAFNWCLYEIHTFDEKLLLNMDIVREHLNSTGSYSVFVEIQLVHDQKSYTIKREEFYTIEFGKCKKQGKSVLNISYKEANGETQFIKQGGPLGFNQLKATIEKILPQELSSYFFFDGERINTIDKKSNVKQAVRNLMGIEVIANAADHLNPKSRDTVCGKLNQELDLQSDKDSEKLLKQRDNFLSKIEIPKAFIKAAEQEIEQLKVLIQKDQEYINQNKETQQIQKDKEKLEQELKLDNENLNTSYINLVKDFNTNLFKFFAKPLFKTATEVLHDTRVLTGIPDMSSHTIDYLIQRGTCVCGIELDEVCKSQLKAEQSKLPPKHAGTLVRVFKEHISQYDQDSASWTDSLYADYKRAKELNKIVEHKRKTIKDFSKKLKGNNDIGKIVQDQAEKIKIKDKHIREIDKYKEEIKDYESKIELLNEQISEMASKSSKNNLILKSIDYAKEIYSFFNSSLDDKIQETQKELNESINKIFQKMYHGKRIVEVDANYGVTLQIKDEYGEFVTDTSTGLEVVKNFAFITGLVDIARQKAISKLQSNTNMDASKPYPLVMDAAFSST
ncbi:MAG: AAA family ATPase, partial [Firmicutes bacterium]|nr:AAA family ATPase [Bacillota bacterium]